jgi:hypothetical protein
MTAEKKTYTPEEHELLAAGFAPMNEKQWRSPRVPVDNGAGDKGWTFSLFDSSAHAHAALSKQKASR